MLLIEITFLFNHEKELQYYDDKIIISIVLFLSLGIHNFMLLKKKH